MTFYFWLGMRSFQRMRSFTLWMTFYFYWLWVFATHYYTMNDVLRFTGYEVLSTHYYTMNDVLLLLGMSLCNALLHYEWHFTFDWVWGPFNVWGPLHYEWRFTFDLVWVPEAQLNWNCSEIEEPVRFFQREGAYKEITIMKLKKLIK